MKDFEPIEFKTLDGVILRGNLYRAKGEKTPAIAMTQGLTLLKEHYIDDIARSFAAAGVTALVYDHRGFGDSDASKNNPRHEVNPLQQAEDYHAAVSALINLPGIDASRIAIWGIGHSGGAAMIAAGGKDPRIAAAVLDMPFLSGSRDASAFAPGTLEKAFAEQTARDKNPDLEPQYVKLWPNSLAEAQGKEGEPTFIMGDAAWKFISTSLERSKAAGTPWENKISLQSFYHISKIEPRDYISRIPNIPILYVAAEADPLTGTLDEHKKVFAMAPATAELAIVKPDHLGTYYDQYFKDTMKVQTDWLAKTFVK